MRTADETRTLIEAYIGAFNARDFDVVGDLYAEDATLEDPVGSGVHYGKAAIRAFYEQYRDQWSFLQLTGDFRFATDAIAFSFFCYLGAKEDLMIVQITDTFRFDEQGKIKEMRAFWGDANIHTVASRKSGHGLQLPLAGQVVLVVGDAQIASACSLELARRGAMIAVAGAPEHAETTSRSIVDAGGRAVGLPVDLSDPRALASLSDEVAKRCGRVDACVNAFEGGHADLAELTARATVGQGRFFEAAAHNGAIVNVIMAEWAQARPEAMRTGVSKAYRMNCIERTVGADPTVTAMMIAFLVSPSAAGVHHHILAVAKD